jgi:hypothetical protein
MATSTVAAQTPAVRTSIKERLLKWRKRLFYVLFAMIILFVFVKLADFVWFRTQVPVTFVHANWSGKWESEEWFGFSGKLIVRLPDPLPENQDFKAEALVYYPIYSSWRTGQFVKMDFHGHFSPDSPATAGQSTNDIPGSTGGKLKFKGTAGNQVVEYVALINERRTRIVGGYLSAHPYDFGFFTITNP